MMNNSFLESNSSYSYPIGTILEKYGSTLTLTEDGWRAEVKHSMHRRLLNWDYSKPWIYMVTFDTQHHDVLPQPLIKGYHHSAWLSRVYAKGGHPHLFGELGTKLSSYGNAYIRFNDFGLAVSHCITEIPNFYPQVEVIDHIVMPNHVHMILWVKEQLPDRSGLGTVINQFKSSVNRLYKELVLGVPAVTHMVVEQGVQSFQPQAERTGPKAGHGPKNPHVGLVFEAGFHDRLLFRKGQLEAMKHYVRSNPQRLWEVVHNRQYFEKVAGWRITMPLLPEGGTSHVGRWWSYYPVGREQLMAEGGARGLLAPIERTATTMTMTFNAIGNRQLLKVPERMQI